MTSTPKSTEDQPAAPEADPHGGAIFTPHRRTQFFVLLASILCFSLFWQGGKWLHIPAEPGFQDSMLQQSLWPASFFAIYILLAFAVVVGTLVSGRAWFFGGLFAGAFGLMALSLRGGPMRHVLFHAADSGSTRGVFLQLACEQVLLFVPIGFMWLFFANRYDAALSLVVDKELNPKSRDSGSLAMTLMAQFAFVAVLVLVLTPTDAKKQVLVSVFLAGLAGTALAEYMMPHRKAAAWYWVAPLAVGVCGYVMASLNATDVTTGFANGTFANLAHALPLDYASAGVGGTLVGYWMGAERPVLTASVLNCGCGRNGTA